MFLIRSYLNPWVFVLRCHLLCLMHGTVANLVLVLDMSQPNDIYTPTLSYNGAVGIYTAAIVTM
jgi:hypothetical protein